MSGSLARYLLARVLRAAATVAGVVTLVFLLARLLPGDPVDAILGEQASPEDRAQLRASLHLDEPLPVQYGHFLGNVLDGTLGRSFRHPDRTVRSMIAAVLWPTAQLALSSLVLAWLIALPLGVVAAASHRRALDRWASFVSLLGLAVPTIWLGPILILIFGVWLRWLPMPGDDISDPRTLVLPAITVGTALAAVLTRQTRASMLEVLGQPHVQAARARGLGPRTVLVKHALRNALMPVVTVGAAQLGALLSGAVIAEKIFERPGLGSLFLEGFFARDLPVVQGSVLVVGILYVSVNLAMDLTYGWIDPRVRLG